MPEKNLFLGYVIFQVLCFLSFLLFIKNPFLFIVRDHPAQKKSQDRFWFPCSFLLTGYQRISTDIKTRAIKVRSHIE